MWATPHGYPGDASARPAGRVATTLRARPQKLSETLLFGTLCVFELCSFEKQDVLTRATDG